MPFVKGQSGNPAGRKPRTQATAEILRAIGEMQYPNTDLTYRERAARVLWEQACKGSLQALQFIVERTEGKVPDKVEQTGRSEIVVRVVGDDAHDQF